MSGSINESISLLEIGAHAHQVHTLMQEGTAVAMAGVSFQSRRVMTALDHMGIAVGRGLRVFLWKDGVIGGEEIGISPENYGIYEWLHEEFIDQISEYMSNPPPFTAPASSSGFGWPPGGMQNFTPRRSSVVRKTPALPLYAPKNKADKMTFLKTIAHEILQCENVAEAKRLVAALMMGMTTVF